MPLFHSLVTAPDTHPARWALFLHGILGTGANWRSHARRLVAAHPTWGVALVDLRMHGASQGLAPPHTVAASAADLVALEERVPGPIDGVLGHSFGGKVALSYLSARAMARRAPPSRVWLLDSNPAQRVDWRGSESTRGTLEMLRSMPREFGSRRDFIDRVVAAGHDPPFAHWLAMNLETIGAGVRLRLDLDAIGALLEDYFAVDLWSSIEPPPEGARVVAIVGGRSGVLAKEDRERLDADTQRWPDRIDLRVIADAGHWVHVDAPEEVARILVETAA